MANIQVPTRCPRCKTDGLLTVPADGFRAWQSGELIQRALPNLAPADAERLITGICPSCWDALFPKEDT